MEKPLVLILCTGNSCRSHLAEGILRTAAGDQWRVASAGSKPAGYVHPWRSKDAGWHRSMIFPGIARSI
jgi:protein-tyrosine-phosphatase